MAWADITLPTDTYTDLSPVIYVQDQNGTLIKWADGQAITADSTIRWADGQPFVYYAVATIIETQGSLDDFWVDITDAAIFLTDQNGDIMYTQDGNPIMASGSTSVEWTDIS